MPTSHTLRILITASIVLGCALLGGCDSKDSKKSQKIDLKDLKKPHKDAQTVVAGYFQALATNGYAEAAAYFGPEAFQKMSREQWIQAQPTFAAKRGDYVRHTFKRGKLRMTSESGTTSTMTVAVECQVTYSKYSDTEIFSLIKGPTDGDFKIVGHKLNSPP